MARKKDPKLKELENVIKLCTKLGIAEIKFGDTHVIFGSGTQAPQKPRKAMLRDMDKIEKQALLQELKNEVEDDIAVSHVEDPMAYEEGIVAGYLKDGSGQEANQ